MELANINSKGFVFQGLVNSFHDLGFNRDLMLVSLVHFQIFKSSN
jgi:hypothetical protein